MFIIFFFFFQAEDGIRDYKVTGVQTCALPISPPGAFVSINGLTAGARLTSGKRVGPEWRVSATEISGVSVIPPDGFTGQMLVTAELRDGDGVALTATSTRLSWAAAPGVAAPSLPAPSLPAPSLAAVAPT